MQKILTMQEAAAFFSENTGTHWSELEMLSFFGKHCVTLYGSVPAELPTYYVLFQNGGLRRHPISEPPGTLWGLLEGYAAEELWIEGKTKSMRATFEPFVDFGGCVYFEEELSFERRDARIPHEHLIVALEVWHALQRGSKAPHLVAMAATKTIAQFPPTEGLLAQPAAFEPDTRALSSSPQPRWSLRNPTRYQGYGKPLHDLLKAAHAAGRPIPTARDVLDAFQTKRPPEVIEVMSDGLKYYDGEGGAKFADRSAVKKAIQRLIIGTPECPE